MSAKVNRLRQRLVMLEGQLASLKNKHRREVENLKSSSAYKLMEANERTKKLEDMLNTDRAAVTLVRDKGHYGGRRRGDTWMLSIGVDLDWMRMSIFDSARESGSKGEDVIRVIERELSHKLRVFVSEKVIKEMSGMPMFR